MWREGGNYRHFTAEFKSKAVQLVTQKGMPVRKVARELDIHLNQLLGLDLSKASLRAWLRSFSVCWSACDGASA
jgi:transposase-like protein